MSTIRQSQSQLPRHIIVIDFMIFVLHCRIHIIGETRSYTTYHGDLDRLFWKHIAVVFDGTNIKGYSNGNETHQAGPSFSPSVARGDGLLMAGRYYTGGLLTGGTKQEYCRHNRHCMVDSGS